MATARHIDLSYLAGHPVAVLGLGRSGLPVARTLVASGVDVWAWDDDTTRCDDARAAGANIVNLHIADLAEVETLVLSPGIPHTYPAPHAVVTRAKQAGCAIVCDIALLLEACPEARFIGITGTNGKSTTTALLGHLLTAGERPIAVGGNLGIAAMELPPLGRDGDYVLELSSYQLELLPRPHFAIAVLLNITPDHLDRYDGLEGYAVAKARIFDHQGAPDTAIIAIDDEPTRTLHDRLRAQRAQMVVPVSGERPAPGGVYADDGWLIDDCAGDARQVVRLASLTSLPGRHNAQNAAAAYAAARAAGLSSEIIVERLVSFAGLPHRQEAVARVDGVLYVNDSKATNAASAARALACYGTIYWIAGGLAKQGGLSELLEHLGGVRHVFLIGNAAATLAALLDGQVPVTMSGDLATAVAQAASQVRADAARNAVVLLSPACASFDQFTDFTARGDAFRAAVAALPGEHQGAQAAMVGQA